MSDFSGRRATARWARSFVRQAPGALAVPALDRDPPPHRAYPPAATGAPCSATALPHPDADKSDEELITEAIEKKDVGLIKAVKNLGKAKGDQKMPLITILNHQGWIGPFDEYALETLWGSFGDKVLHGRQGQPR